MNNRRWYPVSRLAPEQIKVLKHSMDPSMTVLLPGVETATAYGCKLVSYHRGGEDQSRVDLDLPVALPCSVISRPTQGPSSSGAVKPRVLPARRARYPAMSRSPRSPSLSSSRAFGSSIVYHRVWPPIISLWQCGPSGRSTFRPCVRLGCTRHPPREPPHHFRPRRWKADPGGRQAPSGAVPGGRPRELP